MSEQNTDHDMLIEVVTILKELKKDFENHLSDHKKYMIMAWTTCIGLVITLITLILRLV